MTFQKWSAPVLGLWVLVVVVSVGTCFAAEITQTNPEGLVIASVETEGNITITRAKILSTATVKAGEFFDTSVVTSDVELIGRLDGVERAWYNAKVVDGKVKLTFVVVEKNLVRSISLIGNKKLKAGKLTKELGIKVGDYLDLFLVRNGIEALTELYRKEGYAFAEVKLEENRLSVGQVAYTIQEGPRVKIKEIVFQGNDTIKSKELRGVIKTKKRKLLFWSGYYVQKTLSEDILSLQGAYLKQGFLNAHVTSAPSFSEDKASAVITFTIDEGPVFLVDKIVLSGNEFFDEATLTENMRLIEGQYYSSAKAEYDAKQMKNRYLKQGFVEAQVQNRFTFVEGSKVVVEIGISEGERFRIGRINITGNQSIHDKAVRRILDEENFRPGQWYDAEAARGDGKGRLEEIVRRTMRTQSAVIQAVGDTPGQRDANVGLEEGQTGDIQVGAGFDFDSGLVGHVIYNERNFDIANIPESWRDVVSGEAFKGAGQQLRIAVSPGTEVSTFSVGFKEPYLFDKPVALDLVGSGFSRWRESYDENRLKASVSLTKRYEDRWRRGISFRAENVEITDLESDAPQEVRDVKGNNDVFGLRLFIRKDTTDNRFRPSTGYIFDTGYEQVGGDHEFGVASATQRWYTTLHEDLAERKTILETKIYGASIVGGDAPVFEKFYAGGARSIRGFDYRGVSTRGLQTNVANPERKDPIGSDWIVVGNAEIAVPLGDEAFSALFFVDAGTIDTGGLRASVGTGIQIMVPMFGEVPMRFEFAVPVMKEDEDETRVFTFSIGGLF
jgi:outer membrane protein insertion porin family